MKRSWESLLLWGCCIDTPLEVVELGIKRGVGEAQLRCGGRSEIVYWKRTRNTHTKFLPITTLLLDFEKCVEVP